MIHTPADYPWQGPIGGCNEPVLETGSAFRSETLNQVAVRYIGRDHQHLQMKSFLCKSKCMQHAKDKWQTRVSPPRWNFLVWCQMGKAAPKRTGLIYRELGLQGLLIESAAVDRRKKHAEETTVIHRVTDADYRRTDGDSSCDAWRHFMRYQNISDGGEYPRMPRVILLSYESSQESPNNWHNSAA